MSGTNETDTFSHRAGYHADPLAVVIKQARKGGTLAAGEGALLVAEIDRLTAAVERVRGMHTHIDTFSAGSPYRWVSTNCNVCFPERHPCRTLRALDGDA